MAQEILLRLYVTNCGAGTKINKVLTKNGFDINFDNHGRVIKSWKERKIMREVLEEYWYWHKRIFD